MLPLVVPLHMGALHPVEGLVMTALSLGPFVVVAVVVRVASRRDRRSEAEEGAELVSSDAPARGREQVRGAAQATRAADPDRRDVATSTMSTTTETAAPQSVQQ